jgi:hypothetical protein
VAVAVVVAVVEQAPLAAVAVMAAELLRDMAMGPRSATVAGQRFLHLAANIDPAPQQDGSPPRDQEAAVRAVE